MPKCGAHASNSVWEATRDVKCGANTSVAAAARRHRHLACQPRLCVQVTLRAKVTAPILALLSKLAPPRPQGASQTLTPATLEIPQDPALRLLQRLDKVGHGSVAVQRVSQPIPRQATQAPRSENERRGEKVGLLSAHIPLLATDLESIL